MKLTSHSFSNGSAIPYEYAFATIDPVTLFLYRLIVTHILLGARYQLKLNLLSSSAMTAMHRVA